jgi:hypothetical protein
MSAHIQRRAARLPIGINGEVLTPNDLPASRPQRWIVKRKAQIVAAVDCGLLSVEEACSRYGLTLDEFLSWKRDLANGGLPGLHRARIQDHRPRRPERRIRIQAPRWR